MNERLLVKALLQQVEDVVRQRPQDRIISIRVRIGGRAHVDPELLSNAFDDLVHNTARCSPRLHMERAPPEATCGQCGYKFRLNRSQLACEKCGSLRLSLEESEEVYVESILFKDGTMSTKSLIQTLRNTKFLRDFAPQFVEQIAKVAKLRSFKKGEILFDEGQTADKLHLIVSGSVLLRVGTAETGCKDILTVGEGELLGWSSLTDEARYVAKAVAMEPIEVIQIDGCKMREICDSDPRFGYEFLRHAMMALAKRLSETWRQLGIVYLPHQLPFAMSSTAENQ